MEKKLIGICLVFMMTAAPSFAAVQNVKVGGGLKTTSVLRSNFNAGIARDHQNEILSQMHMNIEADLTDNVSTHIGLLQERLWGHSSSDAMASTGSIDLDAASVTLREFLVAPFSVTVGRQELVYGNALIVGGSGNAGAVTDVSDLSDKVNFDAIKAVLAYNPLTVDFFASRISNADTSLASEASMHDNVNLYGVNANYKLGNTMSTVVEAYAFYRQDDSGNTRGAVAPNVKSDTLLVPGIHISTNLVEGMNVQLEGAFQVGQLSNTDADTMQSRRGSFALQGMVNYALPLWKDMRPVFTAAYTYLSGNKPGATKGRWDPMFEDQNGGHIFDTITDSNTNSQLAVVSAEISPLKDLTAVFSWNGLWRAEKAEYVAGSVNSNKHIGCEADMDLAYAYTEDVTLGMSAGYFMTGKEYVTPNNKNASQLLTSVNVLF